MRTPTPISTTLDADAAQRLERRAQTPLTVLSGVADRLADLIGECRRDLARIGGNRDTTHEAKIRRFGERRAQLGEAISTVDSERLAARRSIDEILSEASEVSGDVSEQLLDEMRLTRTWARVQRLLDVNGADDALVVAQRAADEGDRMVFRALREEWPAYAAANGASDRRVEHTLGVLDTLEAALLSAPERTIRELAEQAETADYAARLSVDQARLEVEGKAASTLMRPDKTVIHLDEVEPPTPTPATGGVGGLV